MWAQDFAIWTELKKKIMAHFMTMRSINIVTSLIRLFKSFDTLLCLNMVQDYDIYFLFRWLEFYFADVISENKYML